MFLFIIYLGLEPSQTYKVHVAAMTAKGAGPYSKWAVATTDKIGRFVTVYTDSGARCSSVVRAFAHGAMGRRIDPSWGGPIELFLVPASAPRLV